jgi:bifunctional UDP-N-acetylglucosamine pyrophosphorylase/glucosamine-1-phosphate N-acetyltransferase
MSPTKPNLPPFDAVILAAGLGTRMKSARPKVLHPAAGRPLVEHVLRALAPLGAVRTVVVVGAGAEEVERTLSGRGLLFVRQDPPLGTGDAVRKAEAQLGGSGRFVLILSGDVPLVRTSTLARLLGVAAGSGGGGAMLTARLAHPGAYGRVDRDPQGRVGRIIEARDATSEQLTIPEVNAGLYALPEGPLWEELARLEPKNAQKEYYLTDAVAALTRRGLPVLPVLLEDPEEMSGVNTRAELAEVGKVLALRTAERLLAAGVSILDPATTFLDDTVEAEADSTIFPFVRLEGATRIARGATIRSFCRLTNVVLGEDAEILEGVVATDSEIGPRAHVGPWAHLRPGTILGEGVKVGNFVETKKARFGKGAKASHLSYIGDAEVGEKVNIGAGTITCNYDGVNKHRTVLEEGVFIGSDTQLVAPVTVGKGAYVGAGTTVTKDVPAGSLAISRSPQKNVEGWVERNAEKRKKKE